MKSMKKSLALMMTVILLASLASVMAYADEPFSTPLFAGQSQLVGNVLVSNDEDNIYVTYQLDDVTISEGWVLTELHMSVEASLNDIPVNKSNNPIPGQFEFKEYFNFEDAVTRGEFAVPIPELIEGKVYIAAHAVVEKHDCVVNAEAPYGGSRVVAYEQGTRYDNTPVKDARSNPSNVLQYETGHSENYFYSLGFQDFDDSGNPTTSYIILEFDDPIVNGAGPDLQVVEDTWGLPYPHERAFVSVSNDGVNWEEVGIADNQTPVNAYHTVSNFELPAGWEFAKYVKVQDDSLRADFNSLYSSQGATLDGYDLNAVLALHDNMTCTEYSETAWGKGTRFNEAKGNWSMYFEYTLEYSNICFDSVIPNYDCNTEANIEFESAV